MTANGKCIFVKIKLNRSKTLFFYFRLELTVTNYESFSLFETPRVHCGFPGSSPGVSPLSCRGIAMPWCPSRFAPCNSRYFFVRSISFSVLSTTSIPWVPPYAAPCVSSRILESLLLTSPCNRCIVLLSLCSTVAPRRCVFLSFYRTFPPCILSAFPFAFPHRFPVSSLVFLLQHVQSKSIRESGALMPLFRHLPRQLTEVRE